MFLLFIPYLKILEIYLRNMKTFLLLSLSIFFTFSCSSVEKKENIDEKAPPVIAPQDSVMNM